MLNTSAFNLSKSDINYAFWREKPVPKDIYFKRAASLLAVAARSRSLALPQ